MHFTRRRFSSWFVSIPVSVDKALSFCNYIQRKVIKTKDASSLNFPLVAAILLNTAVWIVYGLGINNPFVYLPNIFGMHLDKFLISFSPLSPPSGGLLNVAQMVLIVMYRKNKSRVGAEMLNDEADDDLQAELPDQQDPDTDV